MVNIPKILIVVGVLLFGACRPPPPSHYTGEPKPVEIVPLQLNICHSIGTLVAVDYWNDLVGAEVFTINWEASDEGMSLDGKIYLTSAPPEIIDGNAGMATYLNKEGVPINVYDDVPVSVNMVVWNYCTKADLIIAHELGHVLGMVHGPDGTVMGGNTDLLGFETTPAQTEQAKKVAPNICVPTGKCWRLINDVQ